MISDKLVMCSGRETFLVSTANGVIRYMVVKKGAVVRQSLTHSVNDQVVTVCKTFFLHTLNVSDKTVTTALNKLSASGIVCGDKRGKHMNRKKVPAAIRSSVRDHIMMFPKVESHYCCANSSRQYLESGLSVARMYDLYVQHQKEKGEEYASNCTYRKIFKSDFNLSFFYTKKKINVMSVLHSNTAVMISNVL